MREKTMREQSDQLPEPWFVKETGFATRLTPEDREVFMRICPDKTFCKGETIFYAGDPATELHVIAKGQVKLVTQTAAGQERILAICGPFDFIGEAFLHDAGYYRVDAVALTDVVTCPMSRAQFLQVAAEAPTFALGFAEILADHLFDCREQLGAAYDPVKVRLIKVLLNQTRRFGIALDDEGWYRLETELKHEELAALISATRVSVSMAFGELRQEGMVEGTRGQYRIHLPALESLADLDVPGP